MKLCFKTRDAGVGNDYPNIDWMPPLPPNADRLWRRFGDCQNQTYPQLVLSAKGGSWVLYLEGLDSGRNDALSGVGGRIIRNSLYITGTSAEAGDAFQILSAYVEDLKTIKQPQKTFLAASERTVKPGAARAAKNAGDSEQEKVAGDLLSAIRDESAKRMAGKDFPKESTAAVTTGLTDDGKINFLAVCLSLLRGVRNGCAVALAAARLNEKDRIEQMAKESLVAFLSLDERDLKSPKSKNVFAENSDTKDRSNSFGALEASYGWEVEQDAKPDRREKPWKFMIGCIVVGFLVLLIFLVLKSSSSVSRKQSDAENPIHTQNASGLSHDHQ